VIILGSDNRSNGFPSFVQLKLKNKTTVTKEWPQYRVEKWWKLWFQHCSIKTEEKQNDIKGGGW